MSVTKEDFFKYIGEENSLSGYSRSYKLVLYKILIDDIIYKRKSYVEEVAEKFKQFYLDRKNSGKIADKDVDIKIANIETSTTEQVTSVIMTNPYKHISENGYLHIWQDDKQNRYFVFDTVLMRTISDSEWGDLLKIVHKKINLYFSRIDGEENLSGAPKIQEYNNINESNELTYVDFADVSIYCNEDYQPAVLVLNNSIFRLNSWEELFKVYFYILNRTEENNKFFESVCGNVISGFGKRIIRNYARLRAPCKFAKNLYVVCLESKKQRSLSDTEWYASENLKFIKYVNDILSINCGLWIYKRGSEIDNACNYLIDKLSPKGKRNGLKRIKTKSFIAHINAELLDDAEKFYLRIEKEYDNKILLGDIAISEVEEKLLKQYMTSELKRLDNSCTSFKPIRGKIFAFGLVRFAMKYYSSGKFWPFFKDEYGVEVKVNNQREIHEWFQMIMHVTGKTYDENLPQKIDNISLHSFVTDKCAKQFFDYLFDFWRIELNRDIENMYGDGNDVFKALINEIKSNNSIGINNVMKHTSMALELNEKSCKLRIRRFLKLMDACFWNGDVIPETGNRFNELLRKWMTIPNGKFQSELAIKTKKKGVKGQKLLSKPQLQVRFANSTFSLRLPQEILPHCTEEEHPCWKINADGMEPIIIYPDLMQGSVFLFTEETETPIPSEILFKRITMTLYSEKRKFTTFTIKADEVRFFKEDGRHIEYSDYLPAGNLYCYSKIIEVPQILYKEKQIPQSVGVFYVVVYQAEKGDIFLLHNGHAVQVGDRIYEGLNSGSKVNGVVTISDENAYPVYANLPKILFKAPKEKVGGIAIMISGVDKPYKLTDFNYYEFKIDDSIDEIYAYIIDLNDFIFAEGCFQVCINVPNSLKQYVFNLSYIKDFDYRFDDAPYIFKDAGSISFDKKFNLGMKGNAWEQKEDRNILHLNFNPDSEDFSASFIEDWKVNLNYILSGKFVQLRFDIPIFLWKYKEANAWSMNKPADIFLKSLPNKLFVKGPYKFSDKDKNKLFIELKYSDNEDTDMFADPVKDKDYYVYPFGNFKSWLNQDIIRRQIKLRLDGQDINFVDVYCRSIVLNHNLTGDFEEHKLHGDFDVFGDGAYTVSIKKDDAVIAEDLPLIGGKFELETDITFGIYSIGVFELFEDESGFESYNIEIGSYNLEIKDLKNLTQKRLNIKEIKDIGGKYAPIKLDYDYRIENLIKTDYLTLENNGMEVLDLLRDISDEELLGLPMYKCDISNNQGVTFKGLLVFYDRVDIKSTTLLELTKDGTMSLCYDAYRHRLIPAVQANNFRRFERYKRVVLLQDDRYSFVIE